MTHVQRPLPPPRCRRALGRRQHRARGQHRERRLAALALHLRRHRRDEAPPLAARVSSVTPIRSIAGLAYALCFVLAARGGASRSTASRSCSGWPARWSSPAGGARGTGSQPCSATGCPSRSSSSPTTCHAARPTTSASVSLDAPDRRRPAPLPRRGADGLAAAAAARARGPVVGAGRRRGTT